MMQLKLTTILDFSIYFFRKSNQKVSSLSNRFAFKVVRDDIFLIKIDTFAVRLFNGKVT